MPTYEFRCPDGTVIEKFFKISEVPETIPSPNGDGDAVRMISGGAGLVFKGSGFYITDYGKDGKKDLREASAKKDAPKKEASGDSASASSAPAESKSGDAKPSDTKASDSKPAAAPAAAPSSAPKPKTD